MQHRTLLEPFGDRLYRLRMAQSPPWTQLDAAKRVGVKRSTWTCWELGKRVPTLAAAWHIARVYSITMDALVKGTDVERTSSIPRTNAYSRTHVPRNGTRSKEPSSRR